MQSWTAYTCSVLYGRKALAESPVVFIAVFVHNLNAHGGKE